MREREETAPRGRAEPDRAGPGREGAGAVRPRLCQEERWRHLAASLWGRASLRGLGRSAGGAREGAGGCGSRAAGFSRLPVSMSAGCARGCGALRCGEHTEGTGDVGGRSVRVSVGGAEVLPVCECMCTFCV